MSHAKNRSANTVTPQIGGFMPGIDDHELCVRILNLPLGEATRQKVQEIADRLVPGKFGQLGTVMRDQFWKFAVENGAIQRDKPKKKVPIPVQPDCYDARETRGTELAIAHLKKYTRQPNGEMLVPPGRKSA